MMDTISTRSMGFAMLEIMAMERKNQTNGAINSINEERPMQDEYRSNKVPTPSGLQPADGGAIEVITKDLWALANLAGSLVERVDVISNRMFGPEPETVKGESNPVGDNCSSEIANIHLVIRRIRESLKHADEAITRLDRL